MCGIFAIHGHQPVANLETLLRRGADALEHRGPDSHGFYHRPDDRVGLAHRRLSVMAPQNGEQPLSNEDGTIHAIVNGEFYDTEPVRRGLQAAGHTFRTQSDSEVLVHLYEEHGLDCLAQLQGEFAFVLWDDRANRMVAARDRFGVKPLLYTRHNQTLVVASEAKALFAAGVPAAWDMASMQFATSLQYLPADRTLFDGIAMLPPGHVMVAHDEHLTIESYWDIPVGSASATAECANYDDIKQACRHQVIDAVQTRLRADAPVAFQLSGGLDSSSVAGIAASLNPAPIDAFTITFPEASYSERDVALRTATSLGARLHQVEVTQDALLDRLPSAVVASEGLSINGHVAAKSLLHEQVRQAGFKVILTGEGADEAFFGYTHLRLDTAADLVHTDVTSRGMMLPDGPSLSTTAVVERFGFVPWWIQAKASLGHKVQQLMRPEARNADAGSSLGEFAASFSTTSQGVGLSRDTWTKAALGGYILRTLGDGTEMPHSIEGRVPFLDHRLWEFLASVPQSMLISTERDKPLLRDSVSDFVTPEVADRPKHPFDAPPVSVFAGDTGRDFVRDHLQSAAGQAQPFFCPDTVTAQLSTMEQHAELRQVWDPVIMLVLSTIFLQEYMR